jgi:hypothetical protein
MLTKTQGFAASIGILLVCCGVAYAGPADHGGPRKEGPLTLFVAHRENLTVKLRIGPRRIAWTSSGSIVHCEGGRKEFGSISSQGWSAFRVKANGEFQKSLLESYEGSGSYFTALHGWVHRNRVVGYYRAWEERLGEETFYPRCGTGSPRGEDMRFIAHRVEGPPWRPR